MKKEHTENVSYNNGVIYLIDCAGSRDQVLSIVDDGKNTGEIGDSEDYIVVASNMGATAGSIVCVYDGTKDANGKPVLTADSMIVKILEVKNSFDGVHLVYGSVTPAEVFEDIDFYYSDYVDMSDINIAENVSEHLINSFLMSETVQRYVAVAEGALVTQLSESGYDVELLNSKNFHKNVKVKPTIKTKGDTVEVALLLTLSLPIEKDGNRVSTIELSMSLNKDVTLAFLANFNVRYNDKKIGNAYGLSTYDFNARLIDNESFSLDISAVTEGDAKDFKLDNNRFKQEFDRISKGESPVSESVKLAFEENGYGAKKEDKLSFKLFDVQQERGMVTFDCEVVFSLYLEDISASTHFTAKTTQDVMVGVRSGLNGPENYKELSHDIKIVEWILNGGEVKMESGSNLTSTFIVKGFKKDIDVSIDFAAGKYIEGEGFVNLDTQHYAGTVESGYYWSSDAYVHFYADKKDWKNDERSKPLISHGYDHVMLSYVNRDAIKGGKILHLYDKRTDLFALDLLKIYIKEKGRGIGTGRLSVDDKHYDVIVTVKDGRYLSYENGFLIVNENAPLYFEDAVEISIVPKHKKWEKHEEGRKTSYLSKLTINVEFGNEDAYYDSIDTPMQKEFRRLYRNYNSHNEDILFTNFEHLIENVITIPESYEKIFNIIVMEYMNCMFDVLNEYRAIEDDKRTMENRFVYSEAEPFQRTINLLKTIIAEKRTDKPTVFAMLEDVLETTVLYNTLVNVANEQAETDWAEMFTDLDEAYKAEILGAIREFEDEHRDNQKALRLASSFRYFFGFEQRN